MDIPMYDSPVLAIRTDSAEPFNRLKVDCLHNTRAHVFHENFSIVYELKCIMFSSNWGRC